MDDQSAQTTSQIVVSKYTSNIPVRSIFVFVIILTIGFLLGFFTRTFTSPKNPPIIQKPTIDESKLPVSLSLLTNPIVYEWRGSIKGKLMTKDEHTFTLVDNKGNSIRITDITPSGNKWKTLFFDKSNKNKQASYSAIPLGSNLSGDFFVFRNGPNIAVGGMFTKE